MVQQKHGLFQYVRLKLIVLLLRALQAVTSRERRRRDRDLMPPEVLVERVRIPSRETGRFIAADLYLPPGQSSSSSSLSSSSSVAAAASSSSTKQQQQRTPLPVLVNWHGSGFIIPLLGSDALFYARMARDAGIAVLDADYRKGPEHPFPCAVEDAEDALRWVGAQGQGQGQGQCQLDRSRVAVSGFSAGGAIAAAAATAGRRRLRGVVDVRVLVVSYALLDLARPAAEKRVPRPAGAIPAWALRLFNDCYAPDARSRTDPAVSPVLADPADFPPAVALLTAECDTLRPDADALAERLTTASSSGARGKRKVVHKMFEGMRHGFDKGCEEGTPGWTRREEAYAMVAKLLKESFGI